MELFYKTLASLEKVVNDAPISIRNGLKAKRRQARLSLAYAYLKADRKIDAILSVSWPVFKNPGISSIRDFFSICRGFPAETRKKSFDGIEKSAASELKVP
jgi:hypothetical protein